MRCSSTNCGKSVRGGQPEVIMTVKFELYVRFLAKAPQYVIGVERIEDSKRVGKTKAMRARPPPRRR